MHAPQKIAETMVLDRQNLDRMVAPGDTVLAMQALTGG